MTSATTTLLQSTANETIRNSLVTSSSPTHEKEPLSRGDGCKTDDAGENVTFNTDDDASDEGGMDEYDEEDDLCDDEEEEVAALLELEEEEMMKLEEDEMVTEFDSDDTVGCAYSGARQATSQDEEQPVADDIKLHGDADPAVAHQPYQYSRGRARTLSIEIDRFDLDDASTSFFDGIYTGDDVGSLSDLPPLLLSKLLSRSRSNSIVTTYAQGPSKGAEAASVDALTASSPIRSSADASSSAKLAFGADVSIALQRGRGYSLEFFSFGFNTEEPLPQETSSNVGMDCDATPLVKNGVHQRERGDSFIFDINEKLRPRGESISIIFGISDEHRPRGDSIIFDPCSFSDGGIHEQHALLIKNHGSSVGSVNEVEGLHIAPIRDERQEISPDRIASLRSLGGHTTSEPITQKITVNTVSDKGGVSINYTGSTFTMDPCVSVEAPSSSATSSSSCVNCVSMCKSTSCNASSVNDGPSEMMIMPSCLSGNMSLTMEFLNKDGRVGIYLPEERKKRVAKFHLKRKMRIWRKRIKYDCRKKLADSRPRIKGRFVRRSDVESDSIDDAD